MERHPLHQTDLVKILAEFTDTSDDVRCLRVCKAFYTIYIRKVWSCMEINDGSKFCQSFDADIFERHRRLIKHIRIGLNTTSTIMTNETMRSIQNSVLALFLSSPNRLEDILIKTKTLPRQWLTSLLQCQGLREMTFIGNPEMAIVKGDEDLFLQLCGRAFRLRLYGVKLSRMPRTIVSAGISFSNVHHLSLHRMRIGNEVHVEYRIAKYFTNLRTLLSFSCHVPEPGINDHRQKQHFHDFVRSLARFEHLHTLRGSPVYLNDVERATLLQSLNKLEIFSPQHGVFGAHCVQALLCEREDRASLCQWKHSRRLSDTLQILDLHDVSTDANFFSPVMANCPRLWRLTTGDVKASDILSGGEWVCTGLVTLHVRIVLDLDPVTELGQTQLFATLTRINCLKNLQNFDITGTDGGPLRYDKTNIPSVPTSLKVLRNLELLQTLTVMNPLDILTTSDDDLAECLASWPKLIRLCWKPAGLLHTISKEHVQLPQSAMAVLMARGIRQCECEM
jgi:hypothetical protein